MRWFAVVLIFYFLPASAFIDVVSSQNEAEIQTDSDMDFRIKKNSDAYASVLTPEQMKDPLIQSILRTSGRQESLPDPRALFDVMCFKKKFGDSQFEPTAASGNNKKSCNQFRDPVDGKGQKNLFQMTEKCETLIVDYTMRQEDARGWLVNTCVGEPGGGRIIRGPFHVAHGSGMGPIKESDFDVPNSLTGPAYNTSNTKDTYQSAGGFFVATQKYDSKNVGPAMNMQGVEKGINDNACDRRTVVHSGQYVNDVQTSGMSKGCIVMGQETNEIVRAAIAGPGRDSPGEYSGGGLIYVVTNEERLKIGSNCGRNVMTEGTANSIAPIPRPYEEGQNARGKAP